MATQIQARRDTAANWTSINPTLAEGEPGYEIDTARLKLGNGTSAWNSLSYVDTTDSGWTQTGAGAVARTVDSKLKDVVSVKDFGAVGDGIVDDTVAIQSALNLVAQAGSGTVFIPKGTYKVTALTVNITGLTLAIQGDTRGATRIKLTTSAGNYGISVVGPVAATYANPIDGTWGVRIDGITFDGLNSSLDRAALSLERCHGVLITNCFFNQCYSGIRLKDCFFAVVEDIGIWDLEPALGVGIYIDGQQDQYISRVHLDSIAPGGYLYEGKAAVQIVKSGLFNIESMDVAHVRTGLLIDPAAGQLVEWGFVGPAYYDQCSSYGVDINPSGGTVKGLTFLGTWASTCKTGIRVGGTGVIDGFTFNGIRAYNNLVSGFDLQSGKNISICGGSRLSRNGAKVSGTCNTSGTTVTLVSGEANTTWPGNTIVINGVTYTIATILTSSSLTLTTSAGTQTGVNYSFGVTGYGVNINGSVSRVKVSDNLIGQIDDHNTDQNYGISVNNGANFIEIANNQLLGNSNVPIGWNVTNANQSFVVKDNIGLDDQLPTFASASSINVGMFTNIILTGTTTITAIAGPKWMNRQIVFYPQASLTFQIGATIRNTLTTTASVPVIGFCDGSAWYLQ